MRLDQINLVVRDLDASLGFYRLLGIPFGEPTGLHAMASLPGGMTLDLDQQAFARQWNSGAPELSAGSAVFTFGVETRDAVDEVWARMTGAGHQSRQKPYDTFWGCRYAIIADPDGYQIGLMSPSEESMTFWPPTDAPAG